jgi:hypothetical protein
MSDDDGAPEEAPRGRAHRAQYQPKPLVAVLLLVLFVAVVAGVMANVKAVPIGGGSSGASTSTTSPSHATTTTLPRSQVKVQVANGTSVSGLARTYTDQLQVLNWDVLAPINGPKVAATVIFYRPGFQWAAQQIATSLHVPASAVQPWTATSAVPHVAQGVDVAVILGPDVGRG